MSLLLSLLHQWMSGVCSATPDTLWSSSCWEKMCDKETEKGRKWNLTSLFINSSLPEQIYYCLPFRDALLSQGEQVKVEDNKGCSIQSDGIFQRQTATVILVRSEWSTLVQAWLMWKWYFHSRPSGGWLLTGPSAPVSGSNFSPGGWRPAAMAHLDTSLMKEHLSFSHANTDSLRAQGCVWAWLCIRVRKMKMNRFFAAKYKCMFIKQHV